jgi:hypothetical protein
VLASERPTVALPDGLDDDAGLAKLVDIPTPARSWMIDRSAPVVVCGANAHATNVATKCSQFRCVFPLLHARFQLSPRILSSRNEDALKAMLDSFVQKLQGGTGDRGF